jgi:Zn-dependent protease
VLFRLAEPAALVGILLAFLVGVFAHDAAQVFAAKAVRDPTPMRSGRLSGSVKTRISPFSAIAVLIAGFGWAEPVQMNDAWRKRRFHVAAALLAGPLAYLLLAFVMLAVFTAVTEPVVIVEGDRSAEVSDAGFVAELLLWMAVTFGAMFIVSLVPLPPTDGGRVLFLLGPQSQGWQKAHYNLTERNWGVGILLALIVVPVILSLPSVVDQLNPPLLRALGGVIGLDL